MKKNSSLKVNVDIWIRIKLYCKAKNMCIQKWVEDTLLAALNSDKEE